MTVHSPDNVEAQRVALISDVHGNLPAFQAVLADIERAGVDARWCLGDLVGYGAQPDECVALARESCDVCLIGNHDLVVIDKIEITEFSHNAAVAAVWTREHIAQESVDYLSGLASSGQGGELGLYHASPRDPVWEYVLSAPQAGQCMDAMEPRVGAVGHSHVALWFSRTDGGAVSGDQARGGTELDLSQGDWIVNPGGVGQPRDGDPRAAWLLLDLGTWTATWHRVEYEIDAAARAIEQAGLPDVLSKRLYLGQ
ncbi:MAG TPA: metallophosphoesterase family protein [Thermoleophilaceae bacterium]|jgi:diadenosine tetraphosphatase ApaH/serine/threonine PP2A family protein phosphatase